MSLLTIAFSVSTARARFFFANFSEDHLTFLASRDTLIIQGPFTFETRSSYQLLITTWDIWNYVRTNEATSRATTPRRTPHGCVD